jgi:hypothetical protein
MMTGAPVLNQQPRLEDFRSDYSPEQIAAAEARNVRAIAMQAYLYAFPAFLHLRQLTEFIQGRQYFAPDECPLGGWVIMRELATPATTTVSPNVDTLYGASYLLLDQQGPVVLNVPPIPGRYYSVALLDAYFNNFAIVSPRTYGNEGGAYLVAPPGWSGEPPAGIRAVLYAPTSSVCLLQRIFTRGETEYPALHELQDAIRLTPLDRWLRSESGFPMLDLSPYMLPGLRMLRDPLQFFVHTNAYTGANPPPPGDTGLAALYRTVGVGPGSQLPADPLLQEAIVQGAADAQAIMNARISAGPFRNGWRVPDPASGVAGEAVLVRAAVQATQMGIFPLAEAIYFFGYRDADGETLHGSRRYTITFAAGELPPLYEYGFWSLTMYNDVSLLVDNPLNRYALRPKSPGLTFAPDGSLTLLIQREQPQDADAGNWLPAPAGAFNVALRTYQPQAAIVNGQWFPPAIMRVK